MKLATSDMISKIDDYSETKLGIPVSELMYKSGLAVAKAVRETVALKKCVVILAGKGNNGGDGYAAALNLIDEYDVTVYDVFSGGQNSDSGRYFLSAFLERGGRVVDFSPRADVLSHIKNSDCIVDAIFGTGFHGEMPEGIKALARTVTDAPDAVRIAIDVPLGVNADDGSVSESAISADVTVALSYIKPGIISYPAREYTGRIIYDGLGLPSEQIEDAFSFKYSMIDSEWVKNNLPNRKENSNKGTFGKLLVLTGSRKYRGAAHLSLEAALRGGVGLVNFAGCDELVSELSQKYPETIYTKTKETGEFTEEDTEELLKVSSSYSAILLGSGSDNTRGLLNLVLSFLSESGCPIILDADALNALSTLGDKGTEAIRQSRREVIITPHPLEFARLVGRDVDTVQKHRLELAERFASENHCTVVLKGAGTVIASDKEVYINFIGSSALAKAGSGDVLAGFLASLVAQNAVPLQRAAALAVYFHALAGESLAARYSSYGTTPSDLPKEIASHIAVIEKG